MGWTIDGRNLSTDFVGPRIKTLSVRRHPWEFAVRALMVDFRFAVSTRTLRALRCPSELWRVQLRDLHDAADSANRSTGTVNWQVTRYKGSLSLPMLRQFFTLAEAKARFLPSPSAKSTLSNAGDSCARNEIGRAH